jgi:hypothetical protein
MLILPSGMMFSYTAALAVSQIHQDSVMLNEGGALSIPTPLDTTTHVPAAHTVTAAGSKVAFTTMI